MITDRRLKCYLCGAWDDEELGLGVIDGEAQTVHRSCLKQEYQRRIDMKKTIKQSGVKTWACECGAVNRMGIECMSCGMKQPSAHAVKNLDKKPVAKKVAVKAVPKKKVEKQERVIPKVTKAGAKVLGVTKVDGHEMLRIECIDCGKTRIIHFADAFQVKRCVACQTKYRKSK